MAELEDLSEVIGHIYDTTLDRSLWPSTLARVSRFVGVHSTSILTLDARRTGEILEEDNVIDPYWRDLYFSKYIKLDPFVVNKLFLAPGDIVANTEMMPDEELYKTRVYREWAQPQGLLDCLNGSLERTMGCVAYVAMNMRERSGPETKGRAQLLVPHLRRAVVIGGIVDLCRAKAATFAATLDGLSAGVFFVDADARLKHANAAGQALLGTETALRRAGTRLATHDRITDQALKSALACAADGDLAIGRQGVAVTLGPKGGHQHVAHVLPLGVGDRQRAASAFGATTAIFVQPASLEFVAPPVALARTFGLTLAETRVLVAIVEVGGARLVADALGVAETTIKVHLKSIYRKTGAARQADLVKLAAVYASPLATGHSRDNENKMVADMARRPGSLRS